VSSAARSAPTREWFTHFFDDRYVTELSAQKPSGQTRREVDFLLRTLHLSPGSRLLDVACGYGRHAAELSRRGFHVVGVDLSRSMLAEARRRFREGPRLRFVRADMRRLDFAVEFDAVFSFFTSFGYFTPGQNQAVLRRMARALRPGGRLLVDHRNPAYDAALPRRNWYRAGPNRLILEDRRFDPRTNMSECTQLVVADRRGRAVQRRFRVQEFSLAEWRRMLDGAGLRLIRAYAGYDGRGYRPASSERLIVLAEKSASGRGRSRRNPRGEARS
jgi:SAM-dependent methyltransferase